VIFNTLKIILKSDLCCARGDGFAGVLDTDVVYDEYGLPYIPAKRVKGCLHEAALEILELQQEQEAEKAFESLFGQVGNAAACGLKIGNGRLQNYCVLAAEAAKNQLSPDAVLACFTNVRTRTKIKDGRAEEKSLRSARVIRAGNVFCFDVEYPEVCRDLMEDSCKLLRHMGLNRTRGLGEVACTLEDKIVNNEQENPDYQIKDYMGRKRLVYTLELKEPIISADRYGKPFSSEDYLFGSAVQGWLAGLWLTKNGSPADAHKNDTFRKLFLSGEVIFTCVFPVIDGRVFYPAPLTLKTDKGKEQVADGGVDRLASDFCKRLKSFVALEGNAVFTHQVAKEVSSHHARPADKAIGHATKKEGQFYSYEAIASGYTFSGAVIGSEEALGVIRALLEANPTARLGRSTTAQFGKACMRPTDTAKEPLPEAEQFNIPAEGKCRLVVRTPLILQDGSGTVTPDITLLMNLPGYENLKIERAFCAETVASGYNTKWLLPRPQLRALAEGSVIVLQNMGKKEISLPSMQYIGLRTDCGFGQVSVEAIPQGVLDLKKVVFLHTPNGSAGNELSTQITAQRQKMQTIRDGANYAAEALKLKHAPQNSQCLRLLTILSEAPGFDGLAEKLLKIKQPKQRRQALMLCTNQSASVFETQNPQAADIAGLIRDFSIEKVRSEEYMLYTAFMRAMIQSIKQTRRKEQNKPESGKEQAS